jgi:hypothetical protein
MTFFFRVEGTCDIPKQEVKDSAGNKLFDLLGVGSHSVIPPSVHPKTGRPYTWWSYDGEARSLLDTKLRDLPVITAAQLEELRGAGRSGAQYSYDKALPYNCAPMHRKMLLEDVVEALSCIEAPIGEGAYEDWRNVGFGMSEFFGNDDGRARDAFVRWSEKADQTGAKTTPERFWDGIKDDPRRDDDQKVGILSIYKMAREVDDGPYY